MFVVLKRISSIVIGRWVACLHCVLTQVFVGCFFELPKINGWPGARHDCEQTQMIGGQVSHQLGSLMDLYTTFTKLAGGSIPTDRVVDGIDLSQALFKQTVTDR